MRTIIDLPDTQVHDLAILGERTRQTRAALIRDAIAEYLTRHQPTTRTAAFGLWGPSAEDGLTTQARLRAEW